MKSSMWRISIALGMVLFVAMTANAQQRSYGLMNYLQAERNEIALLQAQATCMQSQGDTMGAALVASYIPDHQMQADMLAAVIKARGGCPENVSANVTPFLGTRQQMLDHDMQQHAQVVSMYQTLRTQSTDDPAVQQLAVAGLNGASRHFSSIQVARSATMSPTTLSTEGLLAALSLERGVIADLQVQSARLTQLGDTNGAAMLRNAIPAHQQQVNNLVAMITQMGGDPTLAVAPPVVALNTRDQIIAHERAVNTQLANTYALPVASLPTGQLSTIFVQGQQISQTQLAMVNNMPTTV
ncbi:MAG: hypothetical protein ACYDBB_12475 [Armatimonadota bacterium]